ncbi:hypothetical protein AGMMS49579_21400 [Spirochaetia bacterium]|nr:hypothetical protein AGMMS49579_21400 [Spirochaetia bacterium]
MKKRFLFVAAIAALALNIYAADSDYTVDANGVITKYSGWDTEVVIPATIGGKKITAIGREAFKKADLTSVVIPEGITEIGGSAFEDNKLTSITIPGTVKTLGNGAFSGNTDIATIVLSEGVEYDNGAFYRHREDVTVTLPSSIKVVKSLFSQSGGEYSSAYGKNATFILAANITADIIDIFPGADSYIANDRKAGTYTVLQKMEYRRKRADGYSYVETPYGAILTVSEWRGGTRVRIPAEIGGIPVKALLGTFDKNYGSTNQIDAVQIPESVTYIGARTFWGQELVSITIPAGVTYIGDSAFAYNGLTSVTIPAGVTYIGDQAFFGNKLTSVTIPAGVTYLGALAFAKNGIKTITIPPSVKTLGHNPLFGAVYNSDDANTVNGASIVIGADVVVGASFYSDSSGRLDRNSFKNAYDKNGRKAGRYTVAVERGTFSETWTYSAR